MLPRGSKYALDTNVFIHAFRDADRAEQVRHWRAGFAPFEHLSAVVAQELRAGARTRAAAAQLQRHVFEPLERRGRVFAPTYSAWKRAGEAIASLCTRDNVSPRSLGRTFMSDVVLAASCRESGVTLVTNNEHDFARIRTVLPFEFVPVWR